MGEATFQANDSLTSLVSRMGTDRDKAATVFYNHPVMTDEQALAAYRGSWLPRKIVDIPALDSCRKWRDWQAKAADIELIEAEEIRLNYKGKVLDALTKARLFGGSAIFIGTGDQNPEKPLDPATVNQGGLKYLTVLSRRDMTAGPIEQDVTSPYHGKPSYYEVTGANVMVRIHPSRLILFVGARQPDSLMTFNALDGWGDSVLTATLDAIKNADSTAGNIASLVFEAKVDVIRIPNFMASLGDERYKAKIIERYTLANMSKGINGTLLLDKEEEYETKGAQLAGLTDILMAFMQIVSGAADIPVTRLLGQSPAGMSATGTSDMKNYHDRIQSIQELEISPALQIADECLIRSALGSRPAEVHSVWAPLEQMSEKERAEIFKTTADAARQLVGSGTGQEIIARDAVSRALVNRLVEDGVLPGLEDAVDVFGEIGEQEPSEAELAASAAAQQPNANNVVRMQQAANDAAPRTLYVTRKVLNAADLIAWAKGQGFKTTLPAGDLHVTIAFSRTPVDWMSIGESWQSELKVAAGGPRLMEQFGEARVLLFKASELQWRHESIKEAGASWDHPEYQPHITISYDPDAPDLADVEPYQGEIILGPELFAEEVKEDWKEGVTEDGGAPFGGATFRGREKAKKPRKRTEV
ncbi:phage portal protein [Rhizobium sp. Leaf321]|uniref:anti-CBASS protein Acb1 family protein n=1 Tax=Rhizobium sp. Leaf321 TaxID=1736335 RepID=UPI0009EB6D79|nr:anti-CBASS Acb1 family protein [Rhizobium sp. Leaf321]